MNAAGDSPTDGQRLGRYELLSRLAVGGMAEIYLARAQGISGFEKLLVLKRILPQHALDPEMLRMFMDEARLTATLTHPHITQVYDVGTQEGTPFFTMEYVHGANLRELLNAEGARLPGMRAGGGGALPDAHAVAIIAAAAAGLHYAHEKAGADGTPLQIVHRDVSPSNVLITYDGAVKLTDFGIAKWASQRTQTQAGAIKGKFAYMSPEQCRSQPVDRRSDVFSLGTLLYELTTGAPPFRGDSDYEILTHIVNVAAAPPQRAGGEYPPDLARIVLRALARAPEDRYPTAQAMQVELETFARQQGLSLSTVNLGAYMHDLFAERLAAWAEAQRAGQTLGQHLRVGEGETRVGAALSPTATDAFVAPGGTTVAAGAATAGVEDNRRSRRWMIVAAAAAAAMVAVAVAAARAPSGRGGGATTTNNPTATAAAPAGATATTGAVAPEPTAVATPQSPVTPMPTLTNEANATGDVAGAPPVPSTPRSKRAAHGRPIRGSAPAAANQHPLGTWDPDSPVPP